MTRNNSPIPRKAVVTLIGAFLACGGIVGATAFFAMPQHAPAPQVAAAATAAAQPDPFASVQITGQAAFVYDVAGGRILYAKNAEAPMALASVTKFMLATVLAETLSPDDIVTITPTAIAQDGDSGLIAGEKWRAQDLIDFTLIMSSNDGAEALAEAAAPKILAKYPDAPNNTPAAATIWRMNQKAKELGMMQSYFLDSNGLDISTSMAGAYGSARDIGILFTYAITHDLDMISGTTHAGGTFTSLDGVEHTAVTTNETLGDVPNLIAGKTGYTDLAGGNLVIAFDSSIGHPVVIVVLGSTWDDRFTDVETLVAAARKELSQ